MTKITLQPTALLSDYAKAHLKELQFGQELPLQQEIEVRPLSWFGRRVKQFHDSSSIIAKIALPILLAISLIGIPLIWMYSREVKVQAKEEALKREAVDNLNLRVAKLNQRALLIEKLAIQGLQELPTLDLKGRIGPSGYIDFLEPADLSANMMKGTDKLGRPFIACKLVAPESKYPSPFVITLFERYTDGSVWTWGGHHFDQEFHEGTGGTGRINTEKAYTFFRDLLAGQNPKLHLAT